MTVLAPPPASSFPAAKWDMGGIAALSGAPACHAAASFPLELPPMAVCGEALTRGTPIAGVLSCILVPQTEFTAAGVDLLAQQLVVGRNFNTSPGFFPEVWRGWRWTILSAFGEAQVSRLLGGWPLVAPFHGMRVIALLPGSERAWARCVYIHRDGSWEGLLDSITVNEIDDATLETMPMPIPLQRGRHWLRRGHIATFRAGDFGVWFTNERMGGLA
jgi:hypothetical protein